MTVQFAQGGKSFFEVQSAGLGQDGRMSVAIDGQSGTVATE